MSISIKILNPQILATISRILRNNKIIHTTGISKKNGKFIVENYISPFNNWNFAQGIVNEIIKQEEIFQCKIECLRIE